MNALTYSVVQERLCAFVLSLQDVGAQPGDVRRALQVLLKGHPDYLAHAVTDFLYVGIEQLIEQCVPGGSSCDPQQVADALREWVYRQEIASGSAALIAMDVLGERLRQVAVEGFTHESDDRVIGYGEELAAAAACYATAGPRAPMPTQWPWPAVWWKPTHRRRNQIKAAALLIAAMEHQERAAARLSSPT